MCNRGHAQVSNTQKKRRPGRLRCYLYGGHPIWNAKVDTPLGKTLGTKWEVSDGVETAWSNNRVQVTHAIKPRYKPNSPLLLRPNNGAARRGLCYRRERMERVGDV